MGLRLALFLTVFIHLVGFGIIVPLLPYYAQTYGATGVEVGLLLASFSAMQFLLSPIWGRLSDRIGRRPMLIGSLVLTAGSYVMFAFAGSLAVLFASRILAGIAGATISTAQAYVADTTPLEKRTQGMGLIFAAFGAGFIFGPAIGGILSHWGYAVPGLAAAGLALAACIAAILFLPESLPREARAEAIAHRSAAPVSRAEMFQRPVIGPGLTLLFLSTVCFAAMEGTFALFGQWRYGLGPRQIGFLLAYAGVLAVILQGGIVGRLARRFGEGSLVRAGYVVMAAGLVAMALAPRLPLMMVALGVTAVGSSLAGPTLAGLVSSAASPIEQGAVLGLYQSMGSLGRAIGPFLGGLAFDHITHPSPMWLAGIVVGLSSILALRLPVRVGARSHTGGLG
jgi:DHA1 family tetracycline resistance protein-like MFS transporter